MRTTLDLEILNANPRIGSNFPAGICERSNYLPLPGLARDTGQCRDWTGQKGVRRETTARLASGG